jgi:hypothetical protein
MSYVKLCVDPVLVTRMTVSATKIGVAIGTVLGRSLPVVIQEVERKSGNRAMRMMDLHTTNDQITPIRWACKGM